MQLDKKMAGGRRDRGCSDFQSRYRRIHDLDLGAINTYDLGPRTFDVGP